MIFDINYHDLVVKEDIPKISKSWKIRIKTAIEQKLMISPQIYGKPLRKSLKGYRRLRVGDYRVVFRIEDSIVKIFLIEHRKIVYRKAFIRIERMN